MDAFNCSSLVNKQYNISTMLILFALTFSAQIAYPIYQALGQNTSIMSLLLPSFIFISLLTIPSLWLGSKLGAKLGLGLINKDQHLYSGISFVLITSVLLGVFLLFLREQLQAYLPEQLPAYGFRGAIGGLLVSIGAALGEEVWFRFGLMTLLFYGYTRVSKQSQISSIAAFTLIALVATTFGLAHLPSLASYDAATSFAMSSTILGNVAVGMLYGWCFWRYGLIMAILAHLTVDIVLHVIPALF